MNPLTRTSETEWIIEATSDMVASLSNCTAGSGKRVTTQEGTYRMPFRIRVTAPLTDPCGCVRRRADRRRADVVHRAAFQNATSSTRSR